MSPVTSPSEGVGCEIKPAEVTDSEALGDLLGLFSERGARSRVLSEVRKLEILPLVFRLVPRKALGLSPIHDRFRPEITRHLVALGLDSPSDELVMALKRICEQIVLSSRELAASVGLEAKRKFGVADLRALGLYGLLEKEQCGRCAVCGVLLGDATSIELDHIVPFYLMGDIPDGRNWRLLCGRCNLGKLSYLSALQGAEAWDWIPPQRVVDAASNSLSLRTRYVTLARQPRCTADGCGRRALDSELRVVQPVLTGLPVSGLLDVRCISHASRSAAFDFDCAESELAEFLDL